MDFEKVLKFMGKVEARAKEIATIAGAAKDAKSKAEALVVRGRVMLGEARAAFEEAMQEVAAEALARNAAAAAAQTGEEAGKVIEEIVGGAVMDAAEEASFPVPEWVYGGFDGSNAKASQDAVLAGASLKDGVLAIEWEKGGCEALGAKDRDDADHTVACLFLSSGKGGKFEWISSSRATREVKSVAEGYKGWPKDALDNGGRLFFCIAGVNDDKATCNGKRTNLVEVARR